MRLTKFFRVCVFGASLYMVGVPIANSASIYGTTFDYRKAEPASSQYPGKTPQQIAEHCKSENLGTMELSTCAQFKFESAKAMLAKTIEATERDIEKNDVELRKNHNPIALPYFKQAQRNWQSYRDNQCYANVYEIGQASIRFIDFWACMEAITKARIGELTKPDITQ
ncbi:lysozyme inhibitor LprI family protein [Paraburkholderia sp. J67]|uniref:lysozyme inhibitor LprI family protein n=1 Tax=Paraburkholderia sp. J67 TaxID=2805435 RepID=UPI002ABE8BC9|nr:lysozyme inhibitor LprI family protein [Paraburkholderia sp. J67]